METIIQLNDIHKVYGKGESCIAALSEINLSIEKGEFLGIIGSSGSGKTTLLNIIGCMDEPTSGNYKLKDQEISKMSASKLARIRNSSFGFVVQDYALIEYLTVYKNIELPLLYANKKNRKERIRAIAAELGIEDKLDQVVMNLSGGQKQRVAIARALVNDADIILADEPTGALDTANGNQVIDILERLNSQGKTIVIVTHNMDIAKRCKNCIRIEDGKIVRSV